jgi:hypothetical protein
MILIEVISKLDIKSLLRKEIRNILKESVAGLRFAKRPATLFVKKSGTSFNYGDDYGGRSVNDDDYETPKDKRITVNITPVMSGDNPKLKDLFPEDEFDDIFWLENHDDNKFIICTEGILINVNSYDGDCDGESSVFGLKVNTKNSNWLTIKEKIKSVLTQADIDDALKKLGEIKSSCELERLPINKNKNIKLDSYSLIGDGNYVDGTFIVRQNGKLGVSLYRGNKLTTVIQPVFDLIDKYDKKTRTIKARKGELVYTFDLTDAKFRSTKERIINTENINDVIGKMKEAYQRSVDSGKYTDSFRQWLEDLDFKKNFNIYF